MKVPKLFSKAIVAMLALSILGASPVYALTPDVIQIEPNLPLLLVPITPKDFKGSFNANGNIVLTWTDTINESSYDISTELGSGGGGITHLGANVTTFTDTTAHHIGEDYIFSVRAINANGSSAWSAQVVLSPSIPATPTNIAGSFEADGDVKITWTDNANNETSIDILLESGGSGGSIPLSANTTSYTDTYTHILNETYYYSVRAKNSFGVSPWTTKVELTPELPAAPSNLTAVVEDDNSIVVKWTDNSTTESGFILDISDSKGGGTSQNIGANLKTYIFDSATVGYTYSFKVRSKNAFGNSGWSNTTSVLIQPATNTEDNTQTNPIFDGTEGSWAKDELQQAYDYGLTYPTIMKSYKKQITREEFCTIVVKLYEKLTGNSAALGDDPFNDTNNPEIIKAYNLGIVQGKGPNTFAPLSNITREEICVMIMRCLEAADPQLDKSIGSSFGFNDASTIHNWALISVKFCYKNEIMKGVGSNLIAPLQNTERQEAIVLLKRTYDKYK